MFSVDRLVVILVAQVFNGCLLPFFSICLLLCINDDQFMGKAPQKGWNNMFLVLGVTVTLLLASNVIVQKVGGVILPPGWSHCSHSQVLSSVLTVVWHRILLALGLAVAIMVTLSVSTSLGGSLLR